MRRSVAIAIAAAVAAALVVAGGSGIASACSLVGPELVAQAEVTAGETLTVTGKRFFTINGAIEADCTGDYELVPADDVTVTAVFETDSGEVVLKLTSAVSLGTEVDDFTIGPLEFQVPADARSVRLTTRPASQPLTITVVGASPTSPADPPPATAVEAEPSYTG